MHLDCIALFSHAASFIVELISQEKQLNHPFKFRGPLKSSAKTGRI